MQVTLELGLYFIQSNGSNSALSPVVYGDIALSIKTQYNAIQFTEVCLPAMFKNFVCEKANFKLHPIYNWKPIKLFQIRGDMRILGGMSDNLADLLNSKSVSDANKEYR